MYGSNTIKRSILLCHPISPVLGNATLVERILYYYDMMFFLLMSSKTHLSKELRPGQLLRRATRNG
jgi:hypothetical protein